MDIKEWSETLKQGKKIIKESSYAEIDDELDEQEIIMEIVGSILNCQDKAVKVFQSESRKAIKKLKTLYPKIKKNQWDNLVDDAIETIVDDGEIIEDFSEKFFNGI